jgi:outer membrane cobalamin receptor
MKTMKLLLPLAAVVLAVVTAQAAEKKAAKTAACCDDGCAAKPTKAQKKIAITGTHIPVVPTIAGNTYVNTVQPVRVITRADLDRSGAQSLGQFLGNRATSVGH